MNKYITHCQVAISATKWNWGNSLVVQWLGLWALTAEGPSSIPDLGAKSPQAMWHGQKKKKRNWEEQGAREPLHLEWQGKEGLSSGELWRHPGIWGKRVSGSVVLEFSSTETEWCSIVGPLYPRILPLQIKNIWKKFQKVPKSKTWIYHVLTTLYLAFTLCSQLFT